MGALKHHGVLGMKWGVRKQSESVKKAIDLSSNIDKRELLSTTDLQALVNRINVEKQLTDISMKEIENSQSIVNIMMKKIGKRIVDSATQDIADLVWKSAFKKINQRFNPT